MQAYRISGRQRQNRSRQHRGICHPRLPLESGPATLHGQLSHQPDRPRAASRQFARRRQQLRSRRQPADVARPSSSPSDQAGGALRRRQRHAQHPAAVSRLPGDLGVARRPDARATPVLERADRPSNRSPTRRSRRRCARATSPTRQFSFMRSPDDVRAAPERAELHRLPSGARHRRLPFPRRRPRRGRRSRTPSICRARRISTATSRARLKILQQLAARRDLCPHYDLAASYALAAAEQASEPSSRGPSSSAAGAAPACCPSADEQPAQMGLPGRASPAPPLFESTNAPGMGTCVPDRPARDRRCHAVSAP